MYKKTVIVISLLILIFAPRPIAGLHNESIAKKAAQEGDFRLAAEAYEKAANQLFWRASLWNEVARARLILGQRDAARLAYNNAMQKNALSAFGWDYLGLEAQEKGKRAQALRYWQNGVSRYPDYLEFYNRLAMAYRAAGDFPEEKAVLQERLARNAEGRDAAYFHYRLGLLLIPDSQKEALEELNRAARVDPKFESAVNTLRAALDLARSEKDPAEKRILLGRGLALVNEWKLAEEVFDNAAQAYPQNASVWAWLGEANQHIDKDPLPALERALSLNPQSALAHSLLGLYWQRKGDTQEAVREFKKVTALEPKNPQWEAALGEAYAQNGDLQLALTAYQKAADLSPEDPRYWQFLALFSARYNMQPEKIGLDAAQKALSLAPRDPAAIDTLGWIYLTMEEDEKAEQYFYEALALDEHWSAARLHLGMLYLKQGHGELAKDALLQAREQTNDPTVAEEASRLLEQYFQD